MKNKLLIIALIAGMSVSAVGCGNVGEVENINSSESSTEKTTSSLTTESSESQTESVTVQTTVSYVSGLSSDKGTETESAGSQNNSVTEIQTSKESSVVNSTSADIQTSEKYSETQNSNIIPTHVYEEISTSTDIQTAAQILLTNLNIIDCMGGCAIESDYDNDFVEYNGRSFRKVLDKNYSSKQDIDNFVASYMTGTSKDYFSFLTNGEKSVFEEIDGELYVANEGRGCGFLWIENDGTYDFTIEDSSNNGFTIMADYEDYGAISCAEVNVVNDNGFWKIENYNRYARTTDDISSDDFIGKWGSYRITMEISSDNQGTFNVNITGSNSAFENSVWKYTCYYDENAKALISTSGEKTDYTYNEEGIVSENESSEEQSAAFYIDNDGVEWKNETSNDSVIFEKAD